MNRNGELSGPQRKSAKRNRSLTLVRLYYLPPITKENGNFKQILPLYQFS